MTFSQKWCELEKAFNEVTEMVRDERQRQLAKWGEQNHDDLPWLAILTEEFGEVGKAIVEGADQDKIKEELVQVGAVVFAWLECLNRRV